MEIWSIGNKAALLIYIITVASFIGESADAWYVLAYLIYIMMNVARPLFKHTVLKQSLSLLSAAFVIACAYRLEPIFLLLLPVNLYELIAQHTHSRWTALLGMLLPVIIVPQELLPLYVLCAIFSFMLHLGIHALSSRLRRLEDDNEIMREDLQRLTRSLHESSEYVRQSEYTIKLEERNRLSQQIHDDVGHSMAGALIQMEAARRLLATDNEKAAELLGNAIGISKDGLERIRLTLKELKPRSEELGINRLRLFVDELSAKRTIKATLAHKGDLDVITPIQWQIIQSNATEAVTNTLKYAQATAIHIEIQVLNKFIKALVSDNGIGTPKVIKGLGILGMEERAAAAGGTVIVDGTDGFHVTTLLPYGEP